MPGADSTTSISGNADVCIVTKPRGSSLTFRQLATIIILLLINLINYMDRFTVAAVMNQLQAYFDINDSQGGLLQTVFVSVFMIAAPGFGYLGDRYNRKLLLAVGISLWSLTVLLSTFVRPQDFWLFAICRGIVGIGESSYVTIGPTIIADMFASDLRSKVLMIYYFAIPVGSGLGFVIGGNMAELTGHWQWGLRLTPIAGVISVLLILLILEDPPRGLSETISSKLQATDWLTDLKQLTKSKTYVWTTFASICVTFVSGALSWWAPIFALRSQEIDKDLTPAESNSLNARMNLIFGIIATIAGFVGVSAGTIIANYWRRSNPAADALTCGWSVLGSVFPIFVGLSIFEEELSAAWVLIFVGVTLLSFNWAKLPDIVLYTTVPYRRSTANAMLLLLSHLLGDAAAPYVIGLVSDALSQDSNSAYVSFQSLKYALYMGPFAAALCGLGFFFASLHLEADRRNVELITKGLIADGSQTHRTSSPEAKATYSSPKNKVRPVMETVHEDQQNSHVNGAHEKSNRTNEEPSVKIDF